MITYWLLMAHLVGDYLLQSDWMATDKTKRAIPAILHAVTYTLPFVFITQSLSALAFIAGTHFLIDHFRLARYVCWAKNFLAPRWIKIEYAGTPVAWLRNHPWTVCKGTGYPDDKPAWLSVWLMIIADNTLHLICNGIAITYL